MHFPYCPIISSEKEITLWNGSGHGEIVFVDCEEFDVDALLQLVVVL
jgi:hypothetical protein